jgi:hypothetical protein
MTQRFSYQPIVFSLLATLIIAGLFYLPYLSVRNKTIETFRTQQILLARQAGSGLQSYFATYAKALSYLSAQTSIHHMDDSGKALLRDFYSLHTEDIRSIQRVSSAGVALFSFPERDAQAGAVIHCQQLQDLQTPAVSEVIHHAEEGEQVYFSIAVVRDNREDGCLAFALPFTQVAKRYLQQIPLHHEGAVLLFSPEGNILSARVTPAHAAQGTGNSPPDPERRPR